MSIRDWLACVAVAILASGTGAMIVFVHRPIRNYEYIAFRAGTHHGQQVMLNELKIAIDNGVDIRRLVDYLASPRNGTRRQRRPRTLDITITCARTHDWRENA